MKGTLKIECIGDNYTQFNKFWQSATSDVIGKSITRLMSGYLPSKFFVAEIVGFHDKFKYKRLFLKFKKSYKNSNSKGSRGVFAFYILESDKIYDIKEPVSWHKTDRYFCTVTKEGDIIKITKETVEKCLRDRLG